MTGRMEGVGCLAVKVMGSSFADIFLQSYFRIHLVITRLRFNFPSHLLKELS